MIRKIFAVCGLVSCALGVSSTSMGAQYELLPPPWISVTVDVLEVKDTLLSVGKEYSIFVAPIVTGGSSYFATVVDGSGTKLYERVPLRTSNCTDSSVAWTTRTIAHVKRGEEHRIELIAYARVLNPCLVILELDLAGQQHTLPGEPNEGRPLG